jgi:hypothetical protein
LETSKYLTRTLKAKRVLTKEYTITLPALDKVHEEVLFVYFKRDFR